jgi:hypothetical protein
MNTASLALATALAAFVGCAQPATAQTQDQTGAAAAAQATPNAGGNATTGTGQSEEDGNWRHDDNQNAGKGGNSRRQWEERGPIAMPIRPMWPQRHMMALRDAGARFHFARGNARIDVTCSAQEDTQACVRGAGELIDKIAELHGANRDGMTGSASGGDERPNAGASSDDDRDSAGERM